MRVAEIWPGKGFRKSAMSKLSKAGRLTTGILDLSCHTMPYHTMPCLFPVPNRTRASELTSWWITEKDKSSRRTSTANHSQALGQSRNVGAWQSKCQALTSIRSLASHIFPQHNLLRLCLVLGSPEPSLPSDGPGSKMIDPSIWDL